MLKQARQIPNHYKHSWIKSPNFNLKGYWPLIGDGSGKKLRGLLKEHHDFVKKPNFNRKGYWPVNGGTHKLSSHLVNVDSWPMGEEHAMPEQHSDANMLSSKFYTHFFDTGSKLKKAGISHKWWDEHNLKHNGVTQVFE